MLFVEDTFQLVMRLPKLFKDLHQKNIIEKILILNEEIKNIE